jgi:hypothetical protein
MEQRRSSRLSLGTLMPKLFTNFEQFLLALIAHPDTPS